MRGQKNKGGRNEKSDKERCQREAAKGNRRRRWRDSISSNTSNSYLLTHTLGVYAARCQLGSDKVFLNGNNNSTVLQALLGKFISQVQSPPMLDCPFF